MGFPEWKVTTNLTYNIENYSVFLQGRWIGDGIIDRNRLESQVRVPGPVPAGFRAGWCVCTNICTLDDNDVPSTYATWMRESQVVLVKMKIWKYLPTSRTCLIVSPWSLLVPPQWAVPVWGRPLTPCTTSSDVATPSV